MRKAYRFFAACGFLVWVFGVGAIINLVHVFIRLGRKFMGSKVAKRIGHILRFAFQMLGAASAFILAYRVDGGYSILFVAIALIIFVAAFGLLLFCTPGELSASTRLLVLNINTYTVVLLGGVLFSHLENVSWPSSPTAFLAVMVLAAFVGPVLPLLKRPRSTRDPGVHFAVHK